jgi:signal transduction histidine kinase
MGVTRHHRQILLFVVAIVVPAGALVGLADRIFTQDRELQAKRAMDQRSAAVEQVRRELSSRLEAIKLQEINRLIRPRDSRGARGSANPAVLFTATVENDRLILPWETTSAADDPGSKSAKHRQAGEAEEFIQKNYAAAAAAYRQALDSSRSVQEGAEARLALARALSRAGNTEEATHQYRLLLEVPAEVRDEQGMGFRFYAAERLLAEGRDADAVRTALRNQLESDERLTLPELYMVRDLLGSTALRSTADGATNEQISGRIAEIQQAEALAKDLPRVRAQMEAGTAPDGSVWVPYGQEPWLVTMASAQPPLPGLVIAVASARVAPPGIRLLGRSATEGDTLGEAFPGLRVEFTDTRFREARGGLPVGLWIAAVALVLGIALFGGYLLLRDVNRDTRMNEVRSQFVASVSHELKTPLTAIRMYAETLALGRARDDNTRSEYLETIVNESERLARLVDNVLDFSKIEQGKKIYRLRPTRLDEVAGSAARAMQFPLAQQGFELRLSIQEEMPEVAADPDAIQQAILNLLTNAMKYSGDAREIDLRLGARNGDAVIEVTDHGLGLAPEEQKHIFEKFYRAPSHESRLIAGTGLGLTLVAHIAKAHGGRVEVESAAGTGSTFCLFLPIGAHP